MLRNDRPGGTDANYDRIDRPQLESRLAGPAAAPIAVVVGPAGSGKSDLIRILGRDTNAIVFRVGLEHTTLARFVHGMAQAFAAVAPGAQASFPRAWERALQSNSTTTVLAHWLCEHLDGINARIAIDDLHDANDPSIAAFIGKIAELRPAAPLTIAVRTIGALPIALWMATGRMERPIDAAELHFSQTEVEQLAARLGAVLPQARIDAVLHATGGQPIAVAYALTRLADHAREFSHRAMPATFDEIAQRIFARRTGRQRAFLLTASLFTSLDDDLLARAGWDDTPALRTAMHRDAPFMWEQDVSGRYRFHDRFRTYLMHEFEQRDAEFRATVARCSVHALLSVGYHAAALEVATRQGLSDTVGEVLDAHGFAIVESGDVDAIGEALATFDDTQQSLGASALGLRGYIEARSGRLDTAEAWFRLGLDRAADEASRVAIAMYYARELGLRHREDSWSVLAEFADSPTLALPVAIDVRSSFAQALAVAGRIDEAASRTDQALALLPPDAPPALRARVFARAAYVALDTGSLDLARERAAIAAPLAVAQSLYDVAASTYSVLYNIAYEFDDDAVASLTYLRYMRDLGVKSGTLRLDLYALLCMYELHAEAGDEAALRELERQLAAVDKHDATAEIVETLLPARALQASWNGDFDDAQRLLRPTADHQATPTRKALCWARTALYSAAAGDPQRAAEATRAAHEALGQPEAGTTLLSLTLLTLALEAFVRGDIPGARDALRSADDALVGPAPRLRALSAAIDALAAHATDPDAFAREIPATLAALRAVSFGGMAKLIEALPHPFAPDDFGRQTIGGVLAAQEISARFARAVDLDDNASLHGWLDSVRGINVSSVALTDRFTQWLAGRAACEPYPHTAATRVLQRLAAYRPPAPAILRLVDDVDATIDELFEHLDIAAPLMAEHSRAVSAWCSRLARAIDLSEREIDFITRCGLIHDVGKMRTPAEILHAPRQLTSDEWAIMRDHAAEGGRIVERLPLLRSFAPIVRGHHERLDGNGYPDGLKANAIPLAARIVSVADSFNAMIGRRPYRLPLAPTDALGELDRHRGTQFDPEIVDAMIRIVLGRLTETSALAVF